MTYINPYRNAIAPEMVRSKRKNRSFAANEAKKAKPKISIESHSEKERTNIFIDLLNLEFLFNFFSCPCCKATSCFKVSFTKTNLLNFRLKIKCSLCDFSAEQWALHENFNAVFMAAKTTAGVSNSQTQRIIGMIGMSGKTESGEERVPDFTTSKTATALQKKIDESIINLKTESMLHYRNSLISMCRKSHPQTVEIAIDGAYNDTGKER